MKFDITANAFTASPYAMREFLDCMGRGKFEDAGKTLSLSQHDMSCCDDWVKVGSARVTVELLDAKEIQHEQLAALQAKLQKERADSQIRQNAILEQISKLQALEWDAGVQQ